MYFKPCIEMCLMEKEMLIEIQWHTSFIVYKCASVDRQSPCQFTGLDHVDNLNLGCSLQFLRQDEKECP